MFGRVEDAEAANSRETSPEGLELYRQVIDALNQVRQIIDIARRYGGLDEEDELARFFLSVSEADWQRIEADPPDTLAALLC